MTLTSSAFEPGGAIPMKHAQPSRDVSPPLAWTGQPDSVGSYVLIMHNLSAPSASGLDDVLHWLVWNIPGSATSLPEGVPQGPQVRLPGGAAAAAGGPGGGGAGAGGGIRQISVSGPYYRGPAAAANGPEHFYAFELYAIDGTINVPAVGMSAAETREAVLEAMAGRVRGKGVLVGRFRREPAPSQP